MRIVNINEADYNTLTRNHPNISFYQTSNWAKLKAMTGWQAHYIGYIDDNEHYEGFALMLAKKMPLLNKYLFYAPHGFLIDYKNKTLVEEFHKDLLSYLKKHNAFELIIDPYYECVQRDINGDIVLDGFDNRDVVEHLKSLGYKHTGYNLNYENLQPRWLFRLGLKDISYKDLVKNFSSQVRRKIKKKDYYAIEVRELREDEIPVFKEIMSETAKRKGFIDRSLSYYQKMYETMHKDGILKYMAAEIDLDKCHMNIEKEIKRASDNITKLKNSLELAKEEKKAKIVNQIESEEKVILSNNETLKLVEDMHQKHGSKAILSCICQMNYGKEATMLLAGNDEKMMRYFNTSYIIISELIKKYQEEGYDYYNFYGISGDFNPDSEGYGLYFFKKQYGGEVVELIGQFEYTVQAFYKHLFDIMEKCYFFLKKVRN